ncbi:MAG: hypothetical protein JRH16_15190 [Deltaproteobacteria bacterium]|nr:hypothetical protein [Deltaproteobacteria bacterium]MBW2362373.1 hypothetical protein [Deltaproteobacteria bacterium]
MDERWAIQQVFPPELRLEEAGIDVAGVLTARAFDAAVPAAWRTAALLPSAQSAAVLGCSGRAFGAAFERSPEARDGAADPIDRFTARVVEGAARELRARGAQARALFYWERRSGRFADFVALGRACGLGMPGRLGVLIHPTLGPWIALRAVLLTSETLAPTPSGDGLDACASCPAPCSLACPADAPRAAGFDVQACIRETRAHEPCRVGCAARRACVVGSEHAYPPALERRLRAAVVQGLGHGERGALEGSHRHDR